MLEAERSVQRALESSQPLPASTVQSWMRDLRAGVNQMHTAGLAHGDIKNDNLLLFKNKEGHEQLKLADFDFVTDLGDTNLKPYVRGTQASAIA